MDGGIGGGGEMGTGAVCGRSEDYFNAEIE
jgi:hypothetical protein